MKRIMILALAAMMIFGAAMSASAAEIKAKGEFVFWFNWTDNTNFYDSEEDANNEDDFWADQRFRSQIDIIVSENLKGVIFVEAGTDVWGVGAGQVDNDAGNIEFEARRIYIEFNVPDTDLIFRIGKQGLGLPSAVAGNPLLDGDDVSAVVAMYQFNDMFGLVAFWARYLDGAVREQAQDNQDEIDAFGAILNITIDGATIQPYIAFANIGADSGYAGTDGLQSASAVAAGNDDSFYFWWGIGMAVEVDYFDPLTIMFDIAYGSISTENDENDRRGWFVALEVDYAFDMVTPGIAFWYSSGYDDDADVDERIAHVDGVFGPTTHVFDGSASLNTGAILGNAEGTWGIGLFLKDITFVEDLTHQFRVAYIRGTNDEDGVAAWDAADQTVLADTEWAWEINFDHKYMIYENLAAVLEMGWAGLYLDDDVHNNDDTESAWKLAFGLQYNF